MAKLLGHFEVNFLYKSYLNNCIFDHIIYFKPILIFIKYITL